jgi:hypothetical protein
MFSNLLSSRRAEAAQNHLIADTFIRESTSSYIKSLPFLSSPNSACQVFFALGEPKSTGGGGGSAWRGRIEENFFRSRSSQLSALLFTPGRPSGRPT